MEENANVRFHVRVGGKDLERLRAGVDMSCRGRQIGGERREPAGMKLRLALPWPYIYRLLEHDMSDLGQSFLLLWTLLINLILVLACFFVWVLF